MSGCRCILDPITFSEPDPEAFRLAYEEAKHGLDDQGTATPTPARERCAAITCKRPVS